MADLIVVFGISGVGKTTACRAYASRGAGVLHVGASELLRKQTMLSSSELRMSSQEGILARQMGLKAALDERTRGRSEPIVVLDAHSVVDNDRELVAVPVGVVRALAPTALVLLEAPISAVVSRRTSEERRPSRSEEAIFTEMATARSVVADYALKLRLPLAVGYVVDNFELGTLIERLLQEVRETQEKL